eukprot:CAMPEP_0198599018 /NCGR_PEP_ID=MMETSP1462-20131121/146427_1 /TAXON_ID=1333877 /ORGANISM="Brandtodinium nutriculum, Strain RCC3387" /LENGTH=62 /DNA_ID=CAMNT_0044330697 /DNA_START=641 /DNA_END=829 /DNA_ORIENTATION=+
MNSADILDLQLTIPPPEKQLPNAFHQTRSGITVHLLATPDDFYAPQLTYRLWELDRDGTPLL